MRDREREREREREYEGLEERETLRVWRREREQEIEWLYY